MYKRENRTSERIDYITWLQFIGVMSVIFGHSMNSIDVPTWLVKIKEWIYTYHMPLFFFVSAYLFSYKGGFKRNGYFSTFKNRFTRLIVPYVLWNGAFIIPKIMMSAYINDQVVLSPAYFLRLMLNPRENILGHTWFLFALFEMFIIAILLEKIRENTQLWFPVFAFLIVLNCFGIRNRFLAIGDLMKNAIYFWSGLVLGGIDKDSFDKYCRKNGLLLSVSLAVAFFSVVWYLDNSMLINTLALGVSALCLFALIQMKYEIRHPYIEFVSRNAFPIYITHWPIMMVIRFVVYTKLHLSPLLSQIIMLIGGVVIASVFAFALTKIKNEKLKVLRRYVFGA